MTVCMSSTKTGTTQLTKGKRKIRVEYFAYGQPNSLRAFWSGPGFVDAPLAVGNESNAPVTLDQDTLAGIKAMQMGYTAILCSPDFLYLKEVKEKLTDYEVASRWSYSLWSSMPDQQLLSWQPQVNCINLKSYELKLIACWLLLKQRHLCSTSQNAGCDWIRFQKALSGA